MEPAVLLLRGGLDSIPAFAIAKLEGFACYAMGFRYWQRHKVALARAKEVAVKLGVERHVFVDSHLRQFGGSAFASAKAQSESQMYDLKVMKAVISTSSYPLVFSKM